MRVEVWGDIACPWCYVGRRRFDRALDAFEGRERVDVVLRSFELDPDAPAASPVSLDQALATKYGMSPDEAHRANERLTELAAGEGLEFHLDRVRPTNTFDAHRVLQLAGIRRIRPRVEERFQRAYFSEGALLSDPTTLLELSREVGLSDPDVRRVLGGRAFTLQVRTDEEEAHALGASAVPFFAFDRRRVLAGARSLAEYLAALRAAARPDDAAGEVGGPRSGPSPPTDLSRTVRSRSSR